MGNKNNKMSGAGEASESKEKFNFNMSLTVDDFELLKVVGKGSFGKVIQVKKKDTGKIYAMKILKKQTLVQRKQIKHTETERRILQEIDHPFVVSLRYGFQTEAKLYMVLDYFTGGELFFHLKSGGKFGEVRGKFYAAEIILAIECLHEHDYIYRDLKPENVLLDDQGHVKLTDFGLSKDGVSDNGVTHTFCGTPEYLAPEVIQGAPYGKAVDWWSLGTLLFEMITGLPPFYNSNVHLMYEKILRAQLVFPKVGVSADAQDFLTNILLRDPKKRLGANGAQEIKAHPFFKDIDWDQLYAKQVTPPFVPTTTEGALDTTNVDEEFKAEPAHDTPVFSTMQGGAGPHFEDFTYQGSGNTMAEESVLDA